MSIESLRRSGSELAFDIELQSLAGHKLPTAYPSRRVWLHVSVRDAAGRVLFESGAVGPNGAIAGNANDSDPSEFEPHYQEINRADEVQIYEPILVDWQDRVTTGLLYGVRYIKDNRILPQGFDKAAADEAVAVAGGALSDDDFSAGGDRVRYRLAVSEPGELIIDAELLYQSIGFRWAENLAAYSSPETDRFVGYYRETIADSAVVLAADSASID